MRATVNNLYLLCMWICAREAECCYIRTHFVDRVETTKKKKKKMMMMMMMNAFPELLPPPIFSPLTFSFGEWNVVSLFSIYLCQEQYFFLVQLLHASTHCLPRSGDRVCVHACTQYRHLSSHSLTCPLWPPPKVSQGCKGLDDGDKEEEARGNGDI